MIVLKIFPWGEDIANTYHQKPVHLLKEEASWVLNEKGEDEDKNKTVEDGQRKYHVSFFDGAVHEVTLEKPKHDPCCWRDLFKSSFDMECVCWGDSPKNKTELETDTSQFLYIALDDTAPSPFPWRRFVSGKMPECCGFEVAIIMFRRFLFLFLGSCGAIILMMILDAQYFERKITRLNEFRQEHQVEISDLGYWNYFNVVNRIQPLKTESFRHDILYIFIACLWGLCCLIVSFPYVTSETMKQFYPSRYFGFFDIVESDFGHLIGLRLIYAGLNYRLRFLFRPEFWTKFRNKVFNQRKASDIMKGILSLICVLSAFPIVAMFPPLYSWTSRSKRRGDKDQSNGFFHSLFKDILILLVVGVPGAILLLLLILSLKIYLLFIFFTVTALIFHYSVTIGVFSIAAGVVGFLASLATQMRGVYLSDKTLIHGVISAIHDNKKRDVLKKLNGEKKGQSEQKAVTFVPELVWWWKQEKWNCIPLKLYQDIVKKIRPLGGQRVQILIKVVILVTFVAFISTVMDTLGMNNFDSSFDAMQMILTVVAVTAPALIARFQTTQSKALLEDQKKGIVREVIDEFLKNDEKEKKCFYNYDFISAPSNLCKLISTTSLV